MEIRGLITVIAVTRSKGSIYVIAPPHMLLFLLQSDLLKGKK